MAKLLILADTYAGNLGKPTRIAISFGKTLLDAAGGGSFDIAVIGGGAAGFAGELTGYGAEKVYTVEHPSLENYTAEGWAAALADIAKTAGATHVVGAATTMGKDLLPRTAGLLGAGMAADVLAVGAEGGGVAYKRPMWAGNVVATVVVDTPVHVVSVRTTEFAAAEPSGGASAVTAYSFAPAGDLKTSFVSYEGSGGERPDLGEAERVVAGGRGLKDVESFDKLMGGLADKLGAAIGATRAAVDSGFAPNDLQVGQTGRVVAPDLYIAVGISGAIQHVAGMKGSKCIVAVNKDPEAPIFQVADYGLEADAFKAIPELLEKLG